MKIVEIGQSDVESHAQLLVEVFSQAPWNESWAFKNAYERLLCYKNTPYFLGLSAMHEGELIGFIIGNIEPYLKSSHFILKEMCVKKEQQQTGVGKKLISELHEILQTKKVNTVVLFTRKESAAEIFYLKNGYKLVDSLGLYVNEITA